MSQSTWYTGEFLHVLKAVTIKNAVNVDSSHEIDDKIVTVRITDEKGIRYYLAFNRKGDVGLKIEATKDDVAIQLSFVLPKGSRNN